MAHPVHYPDVILKRLNDLRLQQELCDIVLIVGESKIHAHKVVLASCSPYFNAMFTGNLSERGKTEVEFPSVDELAMKSLIDFAYTGKSLVNEANVQTLLPAANLLQLCTVKEDCCKYLGSQLDPSNCIGIAKFAELHSCHELANRASVFFLQHFEDVCKYEEFLQLSESEVVSILASDDLNVVSEETVFSAVEEWIKYDPDERIASLENLFNCVRLTLLPVRFLTKCYEANSLIRDSHTCRELLNEALKYHLLPEHRLRHGTIAVRTNRKLGMGLVTRPRRPPKVLCAAGGKNGLFAVLDSIEMYVPGNDTWTEVQRLPERRFECGMLTFNNKVYLLGGIVCGFSNKSSMSHHHHSASVLCWDPETNLWNSLPDMSRRRSTLGVAVLDGCIYTLGGYDGETYLRSVERYNPKTDTWEDVAPMLHTRSCFGVAVLDSFIYAVGGYGPPCLNSVERYDPNTDRWELVAPMLEKRINFSVAVLHGFMFVTGGQNGASHLNSCERYDPHTDQWTFVASMDRPRTGLNVAVVDDQLYAVGGHSGSSYLNSVLRYDAYQDVWEEVQSMAHCRCSFGLTAL